jgi:hypothetical protein
LRGADAGLPVDAVVLGRHDRQVVVADDVGEIGVARLQGKDDPVAPVRLDLGHRFENGLGRGLAVLAAMVVDRGHHVIGGDGLAIVKRDATANLEAPGHRVVRGLPALGDIRDDLPGVAHLREVIAQAVAEHLGVAVLEGGRIQGVGRRAVPQAHAEVAALLRSGGMRAAAHEGRDDQGRRPEHRGPRQEFATADAAGTQQSLQFCQICHTFLPPSRIPRTGTPG